MEWTDFWGHIGYIFILIGMILLTRKNIWGWVCRFIGEVVWLLVGLSMGMSSIWFWGSIFLVIDVVGFLKWKREKKSS